MVAAALLGVLAPTALALAEVEHRSPAQHNSNLLRLPREAMALPKMPLALKKTEPNAMDRARCRPPKGRVSATLVC